MLHNSKSEKDKRKQKKMIVIKKKERKKKDNLSNRLSTHVILNKSRERNDNIPTPEAQVAGRLRTPEFCKSRLVKQLPGD